MHTGNLNYELPAQHTYTRASSHLFTLTWLRSASTITHFLLLCFLNISGLLDQISLSGYWCCLDKYLQFRAENKHWFVHIQIPSNITSNNCWILLLCNSIQMFYQSKGQKRQNILSMPHLRIFLWPALSHWQLSIKRHMRLRGPYWLSLSSSI